jgi:hypothetical protein
MLITCRNNPLLGMDLTVEEWTAVLKLSTMWDFSHVRKLAIKELSNVAMNPVHRILLARQCTVQKWLFAGCEELAKRTEPISIREAEQLGWDTAILIFQIREKSLAKFQATRIRSMWEDEGMQVNIEGLFDRTYCNCAEGIRRAFSKELEEAEE